MKRPSLQAPGNARSTVEAHCQRELLDWRIPILFFAALMAALSLQDVHAKTREGLSQDQAPNQLFIRYDRGTMHAHIRNSTLADVSRALAQKTGARLVLGDAGAATVPVFATVKALPLREAIAKILGGFSHAIYPGATPGKLEVYVLATMASKEGGKSIISPMGQPSLDRPEPPGGPQDLDVQYRDYQDYYEVLPRPPEQKVP